MRIYVSKYKLNNKINKDIRIVHFSDIHFDLSYNLKRFDMILNKVKLLEPDYICITGDIIDNAGIIKNVGGYHILNDFFTNLSSLAKVIISMGNHEMKYLGNYDNLAYKEVINSFKSMNNIIVLDNSTYVDGDVCFVGFNPSSIYYFKEDKCINELANEYLECNFKLDKNKYNVLLIHTPRNLLEDNIYNKCNFSNYNLILAGHTHGGMMPINILGTRGITVPYHRFFPKNVKGKLTRNKTTLIICSAIVRLSNSSGLGRFNDLYSMHINFINIK